MELFAVRYDIWLVTICCRWLVPVGRSQRVFEWPELFEVRMPASGQLLEVVVLPGAERQ